MSPPAVRQVSENQTGAPPTGKSSHVRRPHVRLECALCRRPLFAGSGSTRGALAECGHVDRNTSVPDVLLHLVGKLFVSDNRV